ncbi:MAG: T9SS type A sorting domain-containing protein [Crocinitomicaceae bacterium]|nr:T9SS type A sorting domain-containing protein [Crocinitomicaceae bacterium]
MRKLVLSLAVFASALTFAQHNQQNWCGFDQHNARLLEQYPGADQVIHETIMRSKEMGATSTGDRAVIGTVPVVVHVIHDGGSSNISYDQIVSAVDQLNEDYQRLNSDTVNTRNTAEAPFEPLASDMQLEFKLAKIDPNGNCTNGVQRRYSPNSTVNAGEDVKFYNSGGLDAWPRDSYLNIWVVESIETSGGGITLGYAQFPYFGQASTYGIVIRNDAFGTMGTAMSGDRTFTHEVGHCLGLFHTFQGGCSMSDCSSDGDYCCDTPPVLEAQWSCGTSQNTCTGIPTNDPYGFDAYDQFENYMSYSPCQNMFSEDQKTVVLGNFSGISWMADLISPANAIATGVNQADQLCKAEFSSTNTLICAGSTVDFTDESYFGITGYTWTFDGGTPATSTAPNPVVTYNTPGTYDVTLEVTDGVSNVITSKTAYVTVLDNPGVSLPYTENFEALTAIPDNQTWMVEDEDGLEPWALNIEFGSSGNQSAWLDNFAKTNGSKDHLMSGPIDLSVVDPSDNVVFTFKYAYNKRSASNDEWLQFYISNDCGESWVLRKNLHGNDLSTQTSIGPYDPAPEDWVEVEVTNINSTYYTSNFRYKFVFENDNGNNIYIDDINIYAGAMTDVDENIADNLSVYPNPVTNQMQISLDVYDTAIYTITLSNVLGQQVALVYQGEILAGQGQVSYDMSALPKGVYFLNIESNGVVKTTKVIKQ